MRYARSLTQFFILVAAQGAVSTSFTLDRPHPAFRPSTTAESRTVGMQAALGPDTAAHACLLDDARLGPVASCRSFDFTIRFESAIFSLLPACIFLAGLAAYHILAWKSVWQERPFLRHSTSTLTQRSLQVALASLLLLLSIAKLSVVTAFTHNHFSLADTIHGWLLVSSSAVEVVASAAMMAIYIAHARWSVTSLSVPLMLAFAYLFCASLLDVARLRTVALSSSIAHQAVFASMTGYEALFATRFAVQLALFLVVGTSSRGDDALKQQRQIPSASFVSRLFFLYLLPTLWRGRRTPLEVKDMEAMDEQFDARRMSRRLYLSWTGTREGGRVNSNITSMEADHTTTKLRSSDEKTDANTDLALQYMRQASKTTANDSTGDIHSGAACPPTPLGYTFGSFRAASTGGVGLARAVFGAMPGALLSPVLPKLVVTATIILKPLLVNATLGYMDDTSGQLSHGLGLVLAFALVYGMAGLATGQYLISVYHNTCQLRAMLVQTVYIKALTLSAATLADSSSALASPTSLTSVDVERIVEAIDAVHEAWSALVILPVATYLLYYQVGLAFIATLIAVLAIFAAIPLVARKVRACQSAWSQKTDQRVSLMASILAHMQAIKMSSPRLESFLGVRLLQMRAEEVQAFRRYGLRLIRVTSLGVVSGEVLLLATIATFAIMVAIGCTDVNGQTIFTSNRIFTTITILAIVDTPLFTLGQRYTIIMSASSSMGRINDFFRAEERPLKEASAHDGAGVTDAREGRHLAADLRDASFAWSSGPGATPSLQGITLRAHAGQVTGIFGTTGSGKSSLLCALLGELPLRAGTCRLPMLQNRAAYVSQVPWVLDTMTIRQNILLGSDEQTHSEERYRAACHACGLDVDLVQMPDGDQSTARQLSGGQRQRLAICRAVYSAADTFLFDDPFSALDAATTAQMLVRLFGPQGILRLGGPGQRSEPATVIMVASSSQVLSYCNTVFRLSSLRDGGQRLEEVKLGGAGAEEMILKDKSQSKGKHREPSETRVSKDDGSPGESTDDADEAGAEQLGTAGDDEERVVFGSISWQVYRSWLQGTGVWPIAAYFVLLLLSNGAYYGEQYWLQAWADDARQGCRSVRQTLGGGLGVFIAIQVTRSLTFVAATTVFLQVAIPRTARHLHAKALAGTLRQPYSFFVGKKTASSGILLNRFSQDLFTLDFVLTRSLMNLVLFGQDLVLALITMVIPAPMLIAVIAVAGFVYFLMYKLYIPTSRHLRRVEMAEKTPLHAHLRSSLGLSALLSIRAERMEDVVAEISARVLDRSQKPYYLLWHVRACLQTWLNLLAAVINTALILFAVLAQRKTGGGGGAASLGVALVSATAVANMLNQLMVSYTEAEIASVALERLDGLSTQQVSEGDEEEGASMMGPADNTKIQRAGICFDRVTLGYDAHSAPVLRDVSFAVPPGTRLAVVGRSGSGKSTMLLSLLGLLMPRTGADGEGCEPAIYVHGQNLRRLSKKEARAQATVISQDPLVLPLSIRENLNPQLDGEEVRKWACLLEEEGRESDDTAAFSRSPASDAELWEVLRKTGLDDLVRSLPGQLEHVVQTGSLSAGQRQLLCLARALVHETPLILFDEATAHIDSETDARVQAILRQVLAKSQATVVTIAHRIQTVIDYDQILVLDHGRVAELDTPRVLLSSRTQFQAFAYEQGLT